MRTFLIIIFISWTFYSCMFDTVYRCVVRNNTNDNVQINVIFDKHKLDSFYRGREYFTFLLDDVGQDSGVSLNQFDTINLTGFYTISPKAEFTLKEGMFGPDYSYYRSIIIVHKDTINLNDKDDIKKAFKYDRGDYVVTIK